MAFNSDDYHAYSMRGSIQSGAGPEPFSFVGRTLHDKHGTMGGLQDAPGNASHDEVFDTGPPVGAHDDQIDVFLLRQRHYLLGSDTPAATGLHVLHGMGAFLHHRLKAFIYCLFRAVEDFTKLFYPVYVTGKILVVDHVDNKELCLKSFCIFRR